LNADWLCPHEVYLRLADNTVDRQESYRELFNTAISDSDLMEIRECTHKGWALGNGRFRDQIEALGQRCATSKGVGRPRKEGKEP
jgi:putative transposase